MTNVQVTLKIYNNLLQQLLKTHHFKALLFYTFFSNSPHSCVSLSFSTWISFLCTWNTSASITHSTVERNAHPIFVVFFLLITNICPPNSTFTSKYMYKLLLIFTCIIVTILLFCSCQVVYIYTQFGFGKTHCYASLV